MVKLVEKEFASEANAFTHAGVFHADDVLATAILERALDVVILCRVFQVPGEASADAVVYDIGHGKYDHHQRGGNGKRANGIPYASAGLVWRDFGFRAIGASRGADAVWEEVDRTFVQSVDAADNGISLYGGDVTHMDFSRIISNMNPPWNDDGDSTAAFVEAVSFARTVLDGVIRTAKAKVLARSYVEDAVRASDGRVILLDRYVPWRDAILASDDPKAQDIVFVVYPDERNGYDLVCVPDTPDSFDQRLPLPEEWRGLSGTILQNACGVPDAVFCHSNGFICAASSHEGAMEMARLAQMAFQKK